ncbi:hypothetical protein PUR71_14810 [Streptomyces sp. SP17BM10]|uniref:MmyB family transcriptional regulator n=1 Tax=Streptomyces sp. SP17BM10 TaxID=3002530 RepID=UPI002E76B9DB|nr:hypothetical protein [Streptomyces sp. SP17BM10]MEE1784159.1 hypothetical protein [Streptomyces sp. SP17BM10]
MNPPQAAAAPLMRDQDMDRLQLVVDGWLPAPALVVDRHWNTLAVNAEARSLLGVTSDRENYLAAFFLDAAARERYPEWADLAGRLVGQFRILAARYPEDPEFDEIAQRLSEADGEFARLWERHETCDTSVVSMHIRCPAVGSVRYEQVTLGLLEHSDLRLMLYVPDGRRGADTPRDHVR